MLLEKLTERLSEVMTPTQTSHNTSTGATASVSTQNNWVVSTLMQKRIAKSAARSECASDSEIMRKYAQKAIDEYLSLPLTDYRMESSFSFWKEYSKSGGTAQRCLAELAIQYLTPPATSTDIERSNSVGGNVVTPHRNQLEPENTEMLMFLRENWPLINFRY